MFSGRDILAKLIIRFFLTDKALKPSSMPLIQSIQPVTNVDSFARIKILAQFRPVSGTGLLTAFTVPPGVKWTVQAIKVYKVSGTFTFNTITATSPPPLSASLPMKDATSAGAVATYAGASFALGPGYLIDATVDTYSATGFAACVILVTEEDYNE